MILYTMHVVRVAWMPGFFSVFGHYYMNRNIVQWFYAHAGMFCSIKHEQKLYYFELQYFKSIQVTENCAIFILVN